MADGIGGRLTTLLSNRVVWLTDQRRDASGEASAAPALLVLLGREHYVERRRTYPISSRRDLDGVLKQELSGASATLTLVAPTRDDKREVTFYELKPGVLERVGRCVWLVPESLALAQTLPAGSVASAERHGLRYFVAANGVSQAAAGAVSSAQFFALAAGLDVGEYLAIPEAGLRERLLAGLRRLPADVWMRFRMPALRARLQVNWRPLLTAAAVAGLAYLAVASVYLAATQKAREGELAGLGDQVEDLLVAQRDVDRMLAEQKGLAGLLAERRHTYRIWQVVSVAWSKGATLRSVELKDATLTLRGNAKVATDVLAAVAAVPGFADAKFSSPVRKGNFDLEEFTLTLTMQPEAERG
jgi:hypothetical protein